MVAYERWSHVDVRRRCYYKHSMVSHIGIGLECEKWKVVFHYHSAVRQANCPRKENSQACFKTVESLAYDFYDGSFKTDCIFLVQSFTFYQKLMASGSEHPHPPRRCTQQKAKFYTERLRSEVHALAIYKPFSDRNCDTQSSPITSIETWYLFYIPTNWKSSLSTLSHMAMASYSKNSYTGV